MKVFELNEDYSYQGFDIIDENKERLFWDFLRESWGQPIENWRPLAVTASKDELPPCDFPSLTAGVFVFNRRAKEALEDLLEPVGQFLPLLTSQGEHYAYNVINRIDVLNEERSEVSRFESGRVMMVRRYEFHPEKVQNQVIFQIPQETTRIYVTHNFMERVEKYGLTGLKPRLLWSYDERS